MGQLSERQKQLAALLLEEKRRLWTEVRRELFDQVGDKLHAEYDIPQDVGDEGMIDVLEDIGLAVADIRCQDLTRIEEVLRQLKEGRYGLCVDCGAEISLKRLQVAPYATRCVGCQEKREGTGEGPGHTL